MEGFGIWDGVKGNDSDAPIKVAKGKTLDVGINPDLMKKIADGLGSNGHGCRFEIIAPLRPIRVVPLSASEGRIGLQMPIRLTV
jgi:hypothetical protein